MGKPAGEATDRNKCTLHEERDIRYVGQQGNNYGEDAPTLRYRIKAVMVEVVDDDDATIRQRFPVMELLGTTELSMDEHYVREADTERSIKESRSEPTKVEQCKAAIVEFWEARGRPDRVPSNLVLGHLGLRGFRRGKTSQTATTELGIVTEAPAEIGEHGFWNFEVLLAGPKLSVTAPALGTRPSFNPSFTPGSKADSPHAVHRQVIEKENDGVSRGNSSLRGSVVHSPEGVGNAGEPRGGERRVGCPSCGSNNGIPALDPLAGSAGLHWSASTRIRLGSDRLRIMIGFRRSYTISALSWGKTPRFR